MNRFSDLELRDDHHLMTPSTDDVVTELAGAPAENPLTDDRG